VIAKGEFGYPTVNAREQEQDPDSLLRWFYNVLPVLRQCPEFGSGTCSVLDTKDERVLGLRYDCPTGSVIAVLNLSTEDVTVSLAPQEGATDGFPVDVLSDREYPDAGDFTKVKLDASGYRWLRLSRTVGA
jgi:maltose alpha-D-glucosyltransferase/alpha-amylase